MRAPSFTGQFRRDVKRQEKRGKDMARLRAVIELLISGESLPRELGDHPLKGEWRASRDLHIEPDWILIYTATEDAVRFERTGTHADLFNR
jgi:mRNA interferase YafQ